jgi:hypothetical protein
LRENAREDLVPTNVREGICGQQSASDDFLEEIRAGAEDGAS